MSPTTSATRKHYLPFHAPEIGNEEIESVLETLRSGWLTTGPKVRQFERDFADFVGAKHAIAVNSGTAALHLSLEAAGITSGDEVIVPTMTFAASAEVVTYLGATPVLVDCRTDTMNIDAEAIEQALTSRTRAVVPVHMGGLPCDMERILDIAGRRCLTVVEDAAHALPASWLGHPVGGIGDLTCFSFYATKTMTTGEGGMITTGNDEHADRMRFMSLHGISRDAWKRYTADGDWYYEVLQPGFKYNMPDIAAALGIAQLRKCRRFATARQYIADRYDEAFADLAEIQTPARPDGFEHAWHLYVIRLQLERLTIDRATFIELMKEQNIGTSVHFIPLHLHPYYRERFGYQPQDFPRATALYHQIVSLPIFPAMTDADIDDVIGAVRRIVETHRR